MYFDHVRCTACGAQFDPESINTQGGVAACPACGSQLDVKSLFGVAAHLEEADAPSANIDDLVSGYGDRGDSWRTTGGYDPLAGGGPQGRAPQGQRRAPPSHSTSMTRRVRGDEDEDGEPTGASAVLKALRDLKRKP